MEEIPGLLNKMDRVLIAGGAGFIGRKLVRDFSDNGFNITVLSRSNTVNDCKIQNVLCDVSDSFELQKKLQNQNFDYVINCVGNVDHSAFGSRKELHIFNEHFQALKNLTQLCRNYDLKRFIHIGSGAEYGNVQSPINEDIREQPQSPYALYKLFATNYLQAIAREHAFPATIIRVFQIYGEKQPKNRVIPSAISVLSKNKQFECTSGDQERDFLHVDDLAKLLTSVLKCKNLEPGLILNAGSGVPISIKKLLNLIKEKIGLGTLKFGCKTTLSWETQISYPDLLRTKMLTNWYPKISLEKGLERLICNTSRD